jgi:hypothetical protein
LALPFLLEPEPVPPQLVFELSSLEFREEKQEAEEERPVQ